MTHPTPDSIAVPPRLIPRKTGFTLVVTLTLVILLAIPAVGLLSLSSVALRSSSQDMAMAEAKANAKLALMLAIGDIQKQLGPDKRISFTADQLSTDAATVASTSKHFTGAYKSWDANAVDRPTNPEFLQWFVSGNPTSLVKKDWDWIPSPDHANSIELVGVKSAGPGGDIVKVPVISSNSTAAGRDQFAWWVSDLGTKGLISRAKQLSNGDSTLVREDMQTMPGYGIGNVVLNGDRPFETVDTTDASLDKVITLSNSSLLTGGPVKGLIHDLTAYNRSLITNVRSGGFRKDLSFYLEKDSANKPVEPLYTVKEDAVSKAGINMSELWLHYNIYKELKAGGIFNYTTGGARPATPSYLQMPANRAAAYVDDAYYYKQPTIIQYQTLLSFRAKPAIENGVNGAYLQIVVDPIITYWNPLDVPVVVTPAYNSIKYWQLPYDVKINLGSNTVNASLYNCLGGGDWNYMTVLTGKIQPLVLKPGEVVMVSQGPNTDVVDKNIKGVDNSFIDAVAGWNFGGGIAYFYGITKLFLKAGDSFSYEVNPNSQVSSGSRRWSLNHHEVFYKEDRDWRGETIGIGGISVDYMYGQPHDELNPKPITARLTALSRPSFFGKIPPASTRRLSYEQLVGRKEPFMLYSYRAKTERGSERPSRFLSRFNPKAMFTDFYDLNDNELNMLPYEVQINPLNSFKTPLLEVSANGNAYFGGGMNAEDGNSFLCTHSVPREPLYSLGALQHAFANGHTTLAPTAGVGTIKARQPALPQITHPIGNSFAPSIMPPDKTSGVLNGGRVLADHSYLANRALWDDWFFSGICPQTAATFTTKRSQKQVYQDFIDRKQKLPLHRYVSELGTDTSASAVSKLFTGATLPASDAHLISASLLEAEGMFNVNSTSVEAWKSVLSALKKRNTVTRATASSAEIHTPNQNETPVAGLNSPLETVVDATTPVAIKEPSQWSGRRTLSDDEINALAIEIVNQVRKRGPFLSLADFVNRRITTNETLALAGCIQSALDSTDVPINKGFQDASRSVSSTAAYTFPKAEAGPAATGIPGIVKQADILTPIAPYIAVRSDSFLIRTCGRKLDSNGKILATAYCEAIIQRKADFIDPSNPVTAATSELSSVNKAFGRRFHIVSFRWLSRDEI